MTVPKKKLLYRYVYAEIDHPSNSVICNTNLKLQIIGAFKKEEEVR